MLSKSPPMEHWRGERVGYNRGRVMDRQDANELGENAFKSL